MQKELHLQDGGGGHSVTINSMDLSIDTLLELMTEVATNVEYIGYIWEDDSLSSWKTDTNISSLHPVFEWE